MLKKITDFLEKSLQPIAVRLGQITAIQGISTGMLSTLCITVGASLISILVNLPIEAWQNFLANIGILNPAKELVSATTSLLGIYSVISVSYSYSFQLGQNTLTNVLLSAAVFIILMPQSVTAGETTVSALLTSNLGSNGIFPAILIGVFVPMFYNFLIKHDVRLKLPEQVPPMVSNSMSPIFAAMVIFAATLMVKWGLALTSFGDFFNLLYQILTVPTMANLGTTPVTVMVWCMLRALFWFFGIHPSPLNAMYMPLVSVAVAANIEAFMSGSPLPYKVFTMIVTFCAIGGTGSTLGMNIAMLRAKSERYKALGKVAIIPSIFNINEPLVFGVPMMYNPMMLVPSLLAPVVGTVVCVLFSGLINLNPTVTAPWVLPNPIAGFLCGGIWYFLGVMAAIVLQGLLYLPFFRICDEQAYQEEQAALKAEAEN